MKAPTSSDRRIGIFGGSFNPPHLAHLIIAELVRDQFHLDQIIWLPNHQSPLKRSEDVAPPEQRLEMTRLAIRDNDAFYLSEMEIRRAGVSYTIDSIRAFQEASPDVDFRFITGSDALGQLDYWREPDEILRRVRMIVFQRPGTEKVGPPTGFEDRIDVASAPLLEISGTEIRERIKSGRSFRYMVTEAVHDYILEHGLYRAAKPNSSADAPHAGT